MRTWGLIGVLVTAALPACAGTLYNFTFAGTGNGFPGTATGSGSFTTNDSNNPAGPADLSAFSFSLTDDDGMGDIDNFSWSLTDLLAFEADFTGGAVTGLSLTLDSQPGFFYPDQNFVVMDLGSGDAFTSNSDTGPIMIGTVTMTTPTISTPEPSTLVPVAAGMIGFWLVRRRRSRKLRAY